MNTNISQTSTGGTSVNEDATDSHFLDYFRVIKARKELIFTIILLVIIAGISVTLYLPKIYEASVVIQVEQDTPELSVFGPQSIGASYNPFFLQTEYEIIQTKTILYKVIQNLNLTNSWAETYNNGNPISLKNAYRILRSRLGVEQVRNTTLIELSVRGKDPEECASIANEIALVYRDRRLVEKQNEIRRGLDAIEEELSEQARKVDAAEEKVEKIRQTLGVSFVGRGITIEKQKLRQLEADRIQMKVDMITRKVRLEKLESLEGDELEVAASFTVFDNSLSQIRSQLLDSEVRLELMLTNLGENHPDVLTVKAGVEELKSKLREALDGLKKGLEADYEISKAKLEALEEELEIATQRDIEASGAKILPFEKAYRDLEYQRGIYDALNAKLSQEGIELQIPRTPVEIKEEAEPPSLNEFVSPNLMLNIILSVLLGTLLGFGLAFMLEYLDTSIKTVEDIERYLGLPVIGVIPQKIKPLNQEGPSSPQCEPYRVLRTNVLFSNRGKKSGGAFTVLSGGAGEGKSTTLFNLAYICASMGDKVLVVDSDLRRPVQHSFVNSSNRFGLTNVLLKDVPIEETIKPTDVPNLHFLPSGKLPKSAIGLMDARRLRELIKNLKARYDFVFFDAPPIMGVSDASILASEMDGVLLVVQYRKYPRAMSARAKRMVESMGGNILGVVLNNINIFKDNYYYYQSYYSHYNTTENTADHELGDKDKKNGDAF